MAAKAESESERKETRGKVEDDRKHEYPFKILYYVLNVYCVNTLNGYGLR